MYTVSRGRVHKQLVVRVFCMHMYVRQFEAFSSMSNVSISIVPDDYGEEGLWHALHHHHFSPFIPFSVVGVLGREKLCTTALLRHMMNGLQTVGSRFPGGGHASPRQ